MMGLPEELRVACHGVAAAARHDLRGEGLRMSGFQLLEFGNIADVSREGWRAMSREAFVDIGERTYRARYRKRAALLIAASAHLL